MGQEPTRQCRKLTPHADHRYNVITGRSVLDPGLGIAYCAGVGEPSEFSRMVRPSDVDDLRGALGYDD